MRPIVLAVPIILVVLYFVFNSNREISSESIELTVLVEEQIKTDSEAYSLNERDGSPRANDSRQSFDFIFRSLEQGESLHDVFQSVAALSNESRAEGFYQLFFALAEKEPEFVAEHVLDVELSAASRAIILEILQRNWDPPKLALQWVKEHLAGDERVEGLMLTLGRVAESDPRGAIEESHSAFPLGELRDGALSRIVLSWAEADLHAARNYVLNELSDEDRAMALPFLFKKWVLKDSEGAKSFLSEGEGTPYMAKLVVEHEMVSNPEKAVSWVMSLNDGLREEGLRASVFFWADLSLDSALEYVEGLSGPEKSEVALVLGSAWAHSDPKAAAEWSFEQSDQSYSSDLSQQALYAWQDIDPQSARIWVEALPSSVGKNAGLEMLGEIESSGSKVPSDYAPMIWRFRRDSMYLKMKRYCSECDTTHTHSIHEH